MNTGKKYHTKQREIIIECMKEHADSYITVPQLEQYLRKRNQKVGITTIYRNLDRLERERKLTKVNMQGRGSCYKFLPEQEASLFYLKCEGCGAVINIHCPELEHLYLHVVDEHHVRINPVKTMFYGTCDTCLVH